MKQELTQERLKQLLHYESSTGAFTNVVGRHHSSPKGSCAGSKTVSGYIEIGIDGKSYLAHRLAWLYMTGRWPSEKVDHRDGDKSNNRFENLRDVSHTLNLQNMTKATKANRSGLLGAYRVGNRFKTSIKVDGRLKHIGYFQTAEEAHAAYVQAKRMFHAGCTI